MNFIELFGQGGALMYVLLATSLVAVFIFVERLIFFGSVRKKTIAVFKKVSVLIDNDDYGTAHELSKGFSSPVTELIATILRTGKMGFDKLRVLIDDSIKKEIFFLERNVGVLATISSVAPLIGFLGTVIGMIRAFIELQMAEGSATIAQLSGGIWVALLTTVAGLSVGIVALVFHNILVGMVDKFAYEIEKYYYDTFLNLDKKDK